MELLNSVGNATPAGRKAQTPSFRRHGKNGTSRFRASRFRKSIAFRG